MECNKEEAVRAKEIAEKKMEKQDFLGARKIALKAQQLYPDLENVSQMIMVCDVHCSAENKVYENGKDWYGILKIGPTADEASIKKQYRKFALLLHPDKNKFAGAADAFKLIGEAQRVLLDREKRMIHDSKCRASRPMAPNWAQKQTSSNSNVGKQPWVQNNFMSKTSPFTGFNPQQQQPQRQTQPGISNDRPTFWTVCPFCAVRYQFYRDVVNRVLHCQSCTKAFTAYEIKAQAAPSGANWSRPTFSQQKEVPNQGAFKANMQGTSGNSMPKRGSQGNVSTENKRRGSVLNTGASEDGRESKDNEKCENVDKGVESKSSRKVNGKRGKRVAESSESCSTGSSSDFEEDIVNEENGDVMAEQNFGCYGDYPRRSTRSKQHVSYNENLSDDDGTPSKRAKYSGSFHATEDPLLNKEAPKVGKSNSRQPYMEEDVKQAQQKESAFYEGSLHNGKEESEKGNGETRAKKDGHEKGSHANAESSMTSSPVESADPEIYEYPDPDFNDFDKDRREGCFAVGQTWAVYDTLDAMPRFYARIRKVFSPGFKLRITWLEPDPDDDDEIKWVNEGLPASCGKFKHGNSEDTVDHPMFSHLVYWEKGNRRDTYKIYPRKGETWALFKNWDIKWHSDPDSHRTYEFEFVQVLSEYAEGIGVSVAYLGKLKGFSCLFCRTMKEGTESFQISPNQLFRFSHRVPSFQMSGEERKDVPKGSFELDPASLPTKLEEIAVPEDVKVEAVNMENDISFSESPADEVEPATKFEGNTSGYQGNEKIQLDTEHISLDKDTEDPDAAPLSTAEPFEIPDPEFYNFEGERSPEKFQIGQIWALYSDEDSLPKYYAQIKKIDYRPEFRLHISWLFACPLPRGTIQWRDRYMPISCGMFRSRKDSQIYTETGAFSHKLTVQQTDKKDKKDVHAIFPRKGEVWALYKNWNAGITLSDLESCEYDTVEILKETDSEIKVLVLELVNGFKSVFKAQRKEGSAVTREIPRTELLRFSHQIPAFRLTEERDGSLRGCWELDPAAMPVTSFHSS